MGNCIFCWWQNVGSKGTAGVASVRTDWVSLLPDTGKSSQDQQSYHRAWLSLLAKTVPLFGEAHWRKGSPCQRITTRCNCFLFALPVLKVFHQKIWRVEVTMLSCNLQCCWNTNLRLRMSTNIILLLKFDLVHEIYACSHILIFVLNSGFGVLFVWLFICLF